MSLMNNWWQTSDFRSRIVSQIAGALADHQADPNSEDKMEQFLAQNTSEELEEFIFQKSDKNREDYMAFVADLLLHIRQCKGPPGQGREHLNNNGESSEAASSPLTNGSHSGQEAGAERLSTLEEEETAAPPPEGENAQQKEEQAEKS